MDKLFIVLLCGIPWAAFMFPGLNMWDAQGLFFQVMLMAIIFASLVVNGNKRTVANAPLSLFVLWAGLSTSFLWYNIVTSVREYPVKILFPFLNLLCFVGFYRVAVEFLTREKIEKLLRYMSYSVFIVMAYCLLQILNLDQFYNNIDGSIKTDEIVGTIGNPTHLANYLAMCLPLFFIKTRLCFIGVPILIAVILFTKSASGMAIAILVSIYYLSKRNKTYALLLGVIAFSFAVTMFIKRSDYFDPSGRIEFWKMLYPKFKEHAITGWGMGILDIWNINFRDAVWQHAHNAYYQVVIELGVIGLALLFWSIIDYFKRYKIYADRLSMRLKSMFLGFCLSGLINFPDRIWLTAVIGMVGYSFMFAIKNEEMLNT